MEKIYTTHEIAQIFNVSTISVINWIKQGKLNAHKTPGGHRRVMEKDLSSFCQKFNIPFPNKLGS